MHKKPLETNACYFYSHTCKSVVGSDTSRWGEQNSYSLPTGSWSRHKEEASSTPFLETDIGSSSY